MTAYLAPQFDTQFFDGSTVAAGYKLYTYDSGTTTPKAVYSDQAGTVPHTNPIVLDANGRVTGQMWLGSGEYTFTLKTSADVMVKTWNDVAGSSTIIDSAAYDAAIRADLASTSDASKGAGMVGYQQAGAGAVARTAQSKLRESVSVLDYGADPTGTADSAAAIQAAVDSISTTTAGAGPGGLVYIPAGTYRIETQIDLPYGVSIKGAGGTASILRCYDCDGLNFIKTVEDNDMQTVEDIGLIALSGTNRVGILASAGTWPTSQNDGFYINRVKITGFDVGIYFTNAWQSVITNCLITQVNKAVWLADHATLVTVADNQFVREGGGAGAATNIGVEMSGLDLEANEVRNNFIYGFAVAVKMSDPWSAVVASNTILTVAPNAGGATLIGIDFTTVKEHLNIFDNVIESAGQVLDTVIGIYGRPLSGPSGGATVIQNNRIFDDYGVMTTGIGIQINTPSDTWQNNVTIQNNNVLRFTTYDIAAYNPNAITIQNNRLESTGPTYSLYVSGSIYPPCVIQNNWCVKAVQIEPTEMAQGKALVEHNYANATYRAVDMFKVGSAPTTGTWQQGDIVWNVFATAGGFAGWICTTAGTPGTWKTFGVIAA